MGVCVSESMNAPLVAEVDRALGRLLNLVQLAEQELRDLRENEAPEPAASTINERIGNWLYANWYSPPDPSPSAPPVGSASIYVVAGLRAAVASCSRWESAWVVMQAGANGSCLAGHAGVMRPFRPGDYANLSRPGAPVVPGDNVAVMKRVEWVDERSTFWVTQSDAGPPLDPLVRVYWSVGHDRIGWVLREVVPELDKLDAKYSLKCPSQAAEYARVDSLVVYLEASAWPRCRTRIKKLGRRLSSHLRTAVPPLTLTIAPGVAFAEDGPHTQSFGQSRCMALVPGVLAVLDRHPRSRKQGLSLLAKSLRRNGIDPAKPWLSCK
jgi:hypothetical protein